MNVGVIEFLLRCGGNEGLDRIYDVSPHVAVCSSERMFICTTIFLIRDICTSAPLLLCIPFETTLDEECRDIREWRDGGESSPWEMMSFFCSERGSTSPLCFFFALFNFFSLSLLRVFPCCPLLEFSSQMRFLRLLLLLLSWDIDVSLRQSRLQTWQIG